jgi:hypothetical protein
MLVIINAHFYRKNTAQGGRHDGGHEKIAFLSYEQVIAAIFITSLKIKSNVVLCFSISVSVIGFCDNFFVSMDWGRRIGKFATLMLSKGKFLAEAKNSWQ